MKKKAVIFGITGQDGSYMLELLLKKNYEVHGLIRKSATGNTKNINHLLHDNKIINKKLFLHRGDLLDITSLNSIINNAKPSEIYNFADQDNVSWSYNIPSYSFSITALSVINILEIIRNSKKKIKYFQPVSSNMFALSDQGKQNENTKVSPNSIYSLGKVSAFYACKMYSKIYNLHACGAIFYNHESPRRNTEYVTQKIVNGVCDIYYGNRKFLYLGDINAKIDWGYAKDYVEMAWKIMQQKKPDFFIIASGKTNSVESFAKKCFSYVGLDYKKYLKIDKKLLRPSKTISLCGDLKKSKEILNYKVKTDLDELVSIMMKKRLNVDNSR